MVTWLQQFLAGDVKAISRKSDELENFSKPVSLIWGMKDTVTPIEQGEELNEILNPSSFNQLADIGHMPQLEDPKRFNGILLKVLNGFTKPKLETLLRETIKIEIQ